MMDLAHFNLGLTGKERAAALDWRRLLINSLSDIDHSEIPSEDEFSFRLANVDTVVQMSAKRLAVVVENPLLLDGLPDFIENLLKKIFPFVTWQNSYSGWDLSFLFLAPAARFSYEELVERVRKMAILETFPLWDKIIDVSPVFDIAYPGADRAFFKVGPINEAQLLENYFVHKEDRAFPQSYLAVDAQIISKSPKHISLRDLKELLTSATAFMAAQSVKFEEAILTE